MILIEAVDHPLHDEDLLSQGETARKRRCSVRKLERERAEGRGPAYVQDRGGVYYRWGDIRRYIASLVRDPQAEPGSAAPPAAAAAPAKPRQPKRSVSPRKPRQRATTPGITSTSPVGDRAP
jgi:hypothetical protein